MSFWLQRTRAHSLMTTEVSKLILVQREKLLSLYLVSFSFSCLLHQLLASGAPAQLSGTATSKQQQEVKNQIEHLNAPTCSSSILHIPRAALSAQN